MRKLFLFLFSLAAMAGCGAEAPEADLTDDEFVQLYADAQAEADEELGTLQQALTWNNGYGVLSNGLPCNAPWSGTCSLPGKRTWKVKWDCTGCTTRMNQAVTNTKTVFANRAAAMGITITYVSSGYDVYINKALCTSGSPTCLGQGEPNQLDDAYFMPNAFSVAQEYHFYNVRLNFDGVSITGLTSDQQRMRYANLALHELGHFLGLGHTVAGTCMFVEPQPNPDAACVYSATQQTNVTTWVPNTAD